MSDILLETFNRIDERLHKVGDVTGITSGFTDLDHQTTGFQPTELIILAARPSMGKTALVCNMAEAMARKVGQERSAVQSGTVQSGTGRTIPAITARINGHDCEPEH
jgi:replicative DNA helicase